MLISESLAKSKFPGQDPIGQRLRIGPADGPWNTVVGVVGNVKQTSLAVARPMRCISQARNGACSRTERDGSWFARAAAHRPHSRDQTGDLVGG